MWVKNSKCKIKRAASLKKSRSEERLSVRVSPMCQIYRRYNYLSSRPVSRDRPAHPHTPTHTCTYEWDMMGSTSRLQLTSHTCWTSPHTQLFVWTRSACLEDECVCSNRMGPGSNHCITPPDTHTHSQLSAQCLHVRKLKYIRSLSVSHTRKHRPAHTRSQIMLSGDCS